MARLLLIHWNQPEALERAARLRRAGHEVDVHFDHRGGNELRQTRNRGHDAVVIDLGRLPAHGRSCAVWLRQTKSTRHIPLVFVDGDPEKVASLKQALPDATYTTWARIGPAIRRAMAATPADPVVPASPDYSGTPLPRKLGIKPGTTIALLDAPDGFAELLNPLPNGATVRSGGRGHADAVALFVKSQAELKRRLSAGQRLLRGKSPLWIAWPKKASGIKSDLTENAVRDIALAAGMVDFKVCAIDQTWSGLALARRD